MSWACQGSKTSKVRTTWRRQNALAIVTAVAALVAAVIPVLLTHSGGHLRDVSVDIWLPVVLTGGATLIAGLVTFLVARRWVASASLAEAAISSGRCFGCALFGGHRSDRCAVVRQELLTSVAQHAHRL